MYAEIKPETIKDIEDVTKALGGKLKSITLNRVCDNCKDEAKEAYPYCVNDKDNKYWNHLCNECFDVLGCSYVFEPGFPPQVCEHCGKDIEDFSDLGCEFCDSRYLGNNNPYRRDS